MKADDVQYQLRDWSSIKMRFPLHRSNLLLPEHSVVTYLHVNDISHALLRTAEGEKMKRVTSRELNQDVSRAKRFALVEPVFVTDRGRPTHVLISIDAWRQLSGERENMAQLLAAPHSEAPLDRSFLRHARDKEGRR